MRKKNLLILTYSYIEIDTRVNRQILTLAENYNITLLSYGKADGKNVEHIELPRKNFVNRIVVLLWLLLKNYEKSYWKSSENKFVKQIKLLNKFDLIICNEIDTLPLAVSLFKNCPIYLDLHEYAPLELENSLLWNIIYRKYKHYLCKKYLKYPKVISTVSKMIADKYQSEFEVKNIKVIKNTPLYENLSVGLINHNIKLLFHGSASPERKLIKLIRILKRLDSRFTIDFYLYKQKVWYYYFVRIYSYFSQVQIHKPVPMESLSKNANSYDLGLIVYNNENFNVSAAMPNKLFEYIQGRIGVIVGTSSALKEFVEINKNGIYSEDEDLNDLAAKINALTIQDVIKYKKISNEIASQFCWEQEQKELQKCIRSVYT